MTIVGRTYASVFPDPVGATHIVSLPSNKHPATAHWTPHKEWIPAAWRAERRGAPAREDVRADSWLRREGRFECIDFGRGDEPVSVIFCLGGAGRGFDENENDDESDSSSVSAWAERFRLLGLLFVAPVGFSVVWL